MNVGAGVGVGVRGCLVTGTDTGVGKTVVAAAILARLCADGVDARACKPVVTGTATPDGPEAMADHVLLAACTGQTPDAVCPRTYADAVSPHLAAADAPLDPDALVAHAREVAAGADVLVAEGVGGLLVPLTPQFSMCDYAVALGLPIVVAARPSLGTISHTRLTVAVARAAGLELRGVVMTPWPAEPTLMQRDNASTVAACCDVAVWPLPELAAVVPDDLAAAAAAWPVADWVAMPRGGPSAR